MKVQWYLSFRICLRFSVHNFVVFLFTCNILQLDHFPSFVSLLPLLQWSIATYSTISITPLYPSFPCELITRYHAIQAIKQEREVPFREVFDGRVRRKERERESVWEHASVCVCVSLGGLKRREKECVSAWACPSQCKLSSCERASVGVNAIRAFLIKKRVSLVFDERLCAQFT